MSEKSKAQQALDGFPQELAKLWNTHHGMRQAIADNKRISEPAKRGDLAKLDEEFATERAEIVQRAQAAVVERREEIGPLATSLHPATADVTEQLLRETLKAKIWRRIQPRLEAAAAETDPWRLLEELKELGQRATAAKDDVLADVLREEYESLIPLDAWGLDKSQARQVPRIYREELDKVLEPLTPPSERTKRDLHRDVDRRELSIRDAEAAIDLALANGHRELILTDAEGKPLHAGPESNEGTSSPA